MSNNSVGGGSKGPANGMLLPLPSMSRVRTGSLSSGGGGGALPSGSSNNSLCAPQPQQQQQPGLLPTSPCSSPNISFNDESASPLLIEGGGATSTTSTNTQKETPISLSDSSSVASLSQLLFSPAALNKAANMSAGAPLSPSTPTTPSGAPMPAHVLNNLVKVLEKERETLEEKLRQQLQQSSVSDGKLLTEIRELKMKCNALEAKVADYDERLKLSQEIVNKLSKENTDFERALEAEQGKTEECNKKQKHLEGLLELANENVKQLRGQNSRLIMQNEDYYTKIEAIEKEKGNTEGQKGSEGDGQVPTVMVTPQGQPPKIALGGSMGDNGCGAEINAKLEKLVEHNSDLEAQLVLASSELQLLRGKMEKKAAEIRTIQDEIKKKNDQVPPPTGVVTIVFTTVEGCTEQWEQFPDAMRMALDQYFRILRDKLLTVSGYEVKAEGDAMMVAFQNPTHALLWSFIIQESLLVADWSPVILESKYSAEARNKDGLLLFKGLRARTGLHLGSVLACPNASTSKMEYFGKTVNKAARVTALANGGQILASEELWEKIKNEAKSYDIKAMGEFKLPGFEKKEKIIQILPMSLRERTFPPIKETDAELSITLPQDPSDKSDSTLATDIPTALAYIQGFLRRMESGERENIGFIRDIILRQRRQNLQYTETLESKQDKQKQTNPEEFKTIREKCMSLQIQAVRLEEELASSYARLRQADKDKEALMGVANLSFKPDLSQKQQQQQQPPPKPIAISITPPEETCLLSSQAALSMAQTEILVMKEDKQDLERELSQEKVEKGAVLKHLREIFKEVPDAEGISLTLIAGSTGASKTYVLPQSTAVMAEGLKEEPTAQISVQRLFGASETVVDVFERRIKVLNEKLQSTIKQHQGDIEEYRKDNDKMQKAMKQMEMALQEARREAELIRSRYGLGTTLMSASQSMQSLSTTAPNPLGGGSLTSTVAPPGGGMGNSSSSTSLTSDYRPLAMRRKPSRGGSLVRSATQPAPLEERLMGMDNKSGVPTLSPPASGTTSIATTPRLLGELLPKDRRPSSAALKTVQLEFDDMGAARSKGQKSDMGVPRSAKPGQPRSIRTVDSIRSVDSTTSSLSSASLLSPGGMSNIPTI